MTTNEFQIEFTYDQVSYVGLVQSTPGGGYRVSLESDNQETYLDITLTPSRSKLEDWDFSCGEQEDATTHYDKELLEEIGEQIEGYLTKPKLSASE